eukprot:XP_019929705.1 PREDICTED: uncharacterized protein LOC109620862 [Crassostrea gigas]
MSPGSQVCDCLSVYRVSCNSSVVRALARYARDPGFESRLRLDFSPPVTFGAQRTKSHALSEREGYIIADREGEVPGMALVVLVSPDLEECSIPRQWGFQIETQKHFFSVGIGVGDRSRDCDVTVVVSTLVSIRSGEDYVDVSDGILSSAPPAQVRASSVLLWNTDFFIVNSK